MTARVYSYNEYLAYADADAKARLITVALLFAALAVSLATAICCYFHILSITTYYMVLTLSFAVPFVWHFFVSRLYVRCRIGFVPKPEPKLELKVAGRVEGNKLVVGVWNVGNVEAPVAEIKVCGSGVLKLQPVSVTVRPGERVFVELDMGRDVMFAEKIVVRLACGEVFEAGVDH